MMKTIKAPKEYLIPLEPSYRHLQRTPSHNVLQKAKG
jgi:hypothetical protein